MIPAELKAVLFDKDGTILDFHATYDRAVGVALRAATDSDAALGLAAEAIGYDLTTGRVLADSLFVAGTSADTAVLLAPMADTAAFEAALREAGNQPAPAHGAADLLAWLDDRGIPSAIVTNDSHEGARSQLQGLGWLDHFQILVGANSGYGAKPEPGMITGALRELGVAPDEAIVVGDTGHDMRAAKAAKTPGVLVSNGAEVPASLREVSAMVVNDLAELQTVLEATVTP